MVNTKLPKLKVLWAVDPFPGSFEIQVQAARAARLFLESLSESVVPVHISMPASVLQLGPQDLTFTPYWLEKAEVNLKKLVKKSGLSRVSAPKFIAAKTPSIGSMVNVLLEFAEKEEFDLIVVGTHARNGVSRFFMGSFAERLILQSKIPVLVTNPRAKVTSRVKHLLFPTDLSQISREVFETVVFTAKELQADILLFHQAEFLYPPLPYPFLVPPPSQESLNEILKSTKQEGEAWAQWATNQGVKTVFHLSRVYGEATNGILKAAAKFPNTVICMASQSNRGEALLMGSVTRRVLRAAPCPVYVIHPESDATVAKAKPAPVVPMGSFRAVLT